MSGSRFTIGTTPPPVSIVNGNVDKGTGFMSVDCASGELFITAVSVTFNDIQLNL